jgi:hypothetical protein
VSAVVDLWKHQKATNLAGADETNPRLGRVSEILQNEMRNRVQRENEQFVDRGVGSALDAVSENETLAMCQSWWDEYNEKGLKFRADMLVASAFVARGELQRCLQFSGNRNRFFQRRRSKWNKRFTSLLQV